MVTTANKLNDPHAGDILTNIVFPTWVLFPRIQMMGYLTFDTSALTTD